MSHKAKLYYTAPPDEVFEDMKQACINVWNGYDDHYGYRTEKLERITSISNVEDNFMYMFAMFDHINQAKVVKMLKPETRNEVIDRLIDGGSSEIEMAMMGLAASEEDLLRFVGKYAKLQ